SPVHQGQALPRGPTPSRERVKQQAGEDEPGSRHQQRGKRLDSDVDGQVRRTPHHVDERERQDDLCSRGSRSGERGSGHARGHLLWYKAVNVPIRYHITGRRASEIAESIERGIREGDLTAGTRLPTVRSLASHRGISTATVASA